MISPLLNAKRRQCHMMDFFCLIETNDQACETPALISACLRIPLMERKAMPGTAKSQNCSPGSAVLDESYRLERGRNRVVISTKQALVWDPLSRLSMERQLAASSATLRRFNTKRIQVKGSRNWDRLRLRAGPR